MSERPSHDTILIQAAELVAQRSTCSRLHVGAVLAWDTRIVSSGYNGAPAGREHCSHEDDSPCDVSVHAEANAIGFASRSGADTTQMTLYTTHSPCLPCAERIVKASIPRVVFANMFRSSTGLDRLIAAGVRVHYLPEHMR